MPDIPTVDYERMASLAKALGHPVRVQIVDVLLQLGECLTGDLSERLPVAASTTSQHLKVLSEAGLIKGEIDGPRRNYCVDQNVLNELKALLALLPNKGKSGDSDC